MGSPIGWGASGLAGLPVGLNVISTSLCNVQSLFTHKAVPGRALASTRAAGGTDAAWGIEGEEGMGNPVAPWDTDTRNLPTGPSNHIKPVLEPIAKEYARTS